MIHLEAIIYSRVSSQGQDNARQIINLKKVADEKGWNLKRTFQEKISGTTKAGDRNEFKTLLEYIDKSKVDVVMVSEVSRMGRKVLDVLGAVETLHEKGVGVYFQQFNMLTFQNGRENPTTKMLLQMLAIGSEMENNMRKERQQEGIELAKLKKRYAGRKSGAVAKKEIILKKYSDVVDLINKSELSCRRIASITNRSINTVRKVKSLLAA